MEKLRKIASKLFGLKGYASKPQRLMASAVAETILRDLIAQYRNTTRKVGAGILVVRLDPDGETSQWADAQQLQANLAVAEEFNDESMVELHRVILQRLEKVDAEHEALLLLIHATDHHTDMKVYQFNDTESPERLRELISEWNA